MEVQGWPCPGAPRPHTVLPQGLGGAGLGTGWVFSLSAAPPGCSDVPPAAPGMLLCPGAFRPAGYGSPTLETAHHASPQKRRRFPWEN